MFDHMQTRILSVEIKLLGDLFGQVEAADKKAYQGKRKPECKSPDFDFA